MTKENLLQTVDEDTYVYLLDLQRGWKRSKKKLNDYEALMVFPEARSCIKEKIKDWELAYDTFSKIIQKKLQELQGCEDDFSRWFWREWVKYTDGRQLMVADRHIKRLKRLLYFKHTLKHTGGWIKQTDIEHAGSVPLEELVDVELRTGGSTLYGLCPFHEERTPSFHIYPNQNRWHCYGCGEGGDSISFVQLKHELGFIEAVKYLIQ